MAKITMNTEKKSIYDIFRACRLCGAGGGYKMPIIQNVVNMDAVELRTKIRECVQIEVHSDDKMPPLICELCIDKVNDFYEFFELCKQTNIKTRKRLGLPLQTSPQGSEEDCILGVTEPVFATHDSDDEPLTRTKPADRSKTKKAKTKDREPKKEVKTLVVEPKPRPKPTPITTSTPKVEEKSSLVKRKQPSTAGPASSKKKRPEPPTPPPRAPPRPSPPPPIHTCDICGFTTTSSQGVRTHQRSHTVTYTDVKLSCNACRAWFPSAEAAAAHHRGHRNQPYHCTCCYGDFDTIKEFNSHFEEIPCKKFEELPDPQCDECWREFPTQNILKQHRCLGPDGRPGGKCEDCNRTYATLKNLKKHACSGKRKKPSTVDLSKIDPEMLAKVQPMQIRVAKCDPLLENKIGDHIDVSDVYGHYGTDLACYYPYKYYNSYVQPEESFYTALRNTEEQSESVVNNDESAVKSDASVAKNDDFGDNEDFTSNIDNIISSLDDPGKDLDFDSLKSESCTDLGVNGNDSPVLFSTDSVKNKDGSTEVNGVDSVDDSTKNTENFKDNDTNDSKVPNNDSAVPDNDSPSKNKPLWTPQNDIQSPKSDKASLWTPQNDISPKKDSISPKKNLISPKKDLNSPEKDCVSPTKESISPKKDSVSPKKDYVSPKKDEIQTNGSKEVIDKELLSALDEQIG